MKWKHGSVYSFYNYTYLQTPQYFFSIFVGLAFVIFYKIPNLLRRSDYNIIKAKKLKFGNCHY
jgi:hypothetical protein